MFTRSRSRIAGMVMLLALFTAIDAWSAGTLFVRPLRSSQTYQQISIKRYNVQVDIDDHVATTTVNQTFRNELSGTVEATLVFPLPANAVISDMRYFFNGVWYKADVRERKEAQEAYNKKLRKYLDPALLQEIGDNVFKLNIAPIFGASDVQVQITYTEILPFVLGRTEYKHLLRTTGVSPKPLEQMSMEINVRGSGAFEFIESPTHPFGASHTMQQINEREYRVVIGDENYTANRDYELRMRSKRDGVEMGTLTYVPTEADSFGVNPFYLSWVIPPDSGASPLPKSVTFVADVSSSMEGSRMEQLREAMHLFIDQLSEGDQFNILTFSTGVTAFKQDFAVVGTDVIDEAREFVDSRTALGLTNIGEAFRLGLGMNYDPSTANVMIFLTDGEPSWGMTNKTEILDSVRSWNEQDVRIYPITIGTESSVALMRDIAKETGGFLTEVADGDSIQVKVEDLLTRISMPNLTDLELDYEGLRRLDVHPRVLPNVPVGGRVIETGRYETGGWYEVTLAGNVQDRPFSVSRDVFFSNPDRNNRAVARLWAQAKIKTLLEEIDRVGEQKELVDAVIDLSIRFNILTRYTALYADPDDEDQATSVPGTDRPIESISLHIAPHPATSDSRVTLSLGSDLIGKPVVVELYNSMGQLIAVLFNGVPHSGIVELGTLLPSGAAVAPGAYSIVVTCGDHRHVEPIIISGATR